MINIEIPQVKGLRTVHHQARQLFLLVHVHRSKGYWRARFQSSFREHNHFAQELNRFADIDEDELPIHPVCNEYNSI